MHSDFTVTKGLKITLRDKKKNKNNREESNKRKIRDWRKKTDIPFDFDIIYLERKAFFLSWAIKITLDFFFHKSRQIQKERGCQIKKTLMLSTMVLRKLSKVKTSRGKVATPRKSKSVIDNKSRKVATPTKEASSK